MNKVPPIYITSAPLFAFFQSSHEAWATQQNRLNLTEFLLDVLLSKGELQSEKFDLGKSVQLPNFNFNLRFSNQHVYALLQCMVGDCKGGSSLCKQANFTQRPHSTAH